jgi:hypothetical protein
MNNSSNNYRWKFAFATGTQIEYTPPDVLAKRLPDLLDP